MDVTKVVPQFFYDLISRVLPGAVGVVGICWAINKTAGELAIWPFKGSTALSESTVVLTIALLAVSYLLGQLLSPISDFYEKRILRRIFKRQFGVLRDAISDHGDYSDAVKKVLRRDLPHQDDKEVGRTDKQLGSVLFVFYDWVRVNRPDVGARLAKIRAEYRLYGAIAVIQPLVAGIHLVGAQLSLHERNLLALLVLFLFFCLASWSLVRTYWVFQRSVINNYYAIRSGGEQTAATHSRALADDQAPRAAEAQ